MWIIFHLIQVSAGGSQLVILTSSDQNVPSLVDISRCREDTDRGLVEEQTNPKFEADKIKGPPRDSSRYICYSTVDDGVGIWDLAANKPMRQIERGKFINEGILA